jgi:mannose-6-phosphate isomerase-like protein (cupin superfamily)
MRKILGLLVAVVAYPAIAQQGGGAAPPAQAQAGRGGVVQAARPAQPVNVRNNEQTGLDIDRFIGFPTDSPAHLSHGSLLTHTILKAGNPYEPGPAGAVLEYRKDLSTATLLGHNTTQLVNVPDQFFFYVKDGEGRLDDGKQAWDIHGNVAILVPPNAPHRFTNASDKPMNMIMLTWTAAGTPKSDIIVRDVNLLPWCEENAHWNNFSKCVFGKNDGMMESERVLMVMLQPFAASQPHTHPPGFEEVWVKLSPGVDLSLIGSELRKIPENAAYRVPPNGITEHSNINQNETEGQWWLYIARDRDKRTDLVTGVGTPGGIAASATPPPGPLPSAVIRAGGGNNPNIVRDGTSLPAVQVADIHSKPIK